MAQGKKYNTDVKEQAFALLAVNNSVTYVAERLKLPRSTVATWYKQFNAKSEELAKLEKEKGINDRDLTYELDLAKVRAKNKERFVEKSWEIIGAAQSILERRLLRARDHEEDIDKLIKSLARDEDIPESTRRQLKSRLADLKLENVKEISVVLGTLYDKQALANKEPTSIVDGEVAVRRFEDL